MARAERARKEASKIRHHKACSRDSQAVVGGGGDQGGREAGLRGKYIEEYMFLSRGASQKIRHHEACLEDSQTPANILRRMPWDAGRQEPVV